MKKAAEESETKVIVYKNVNRRILLLARAGFIEELKYAERTPHGRIEYKLTMKGLEQLIPHILADPEGVKNIVGYMDKFGLDKKALGEQLENRAVSMIDALVFYQRYSGLPATHAIFSSEDLEEKEAVRMHYGPRIIKELFDLNIKAKEEKTLEERIAAVSEIADSLALYNSIKIKLPKTLPNSTIKLDARKLHKKILERRAKTGETKLNTEAIKMIISELRSAQPMAAEESSPKKSKKH